MLTITQRESCELSEDEVAAVISLTHSIWPNHEKSVGEQIATFLERHRQYIASYEGALRPSIRHLAWEGEELVGHACTFERLVTTNGRVISVMALSGVCVAPNFRGRGLGKALVLSAFKRVEDGEFSASLFQTPISEFYRKLGATPVGNQFFNSRNPDHPENRPWNDEWVMVYPRSYAWPRGPIDLNGPGY